MTGPGRGAGAPAALGRAFALLDDWISRGVIPGAAALVWHRGLVAGEWYGGWLDAQRTRPVTDSTVFAVASLTKPFTAATVLRLVDSGQLALDEPVYELLPEFLDGAGPQPWRRAVRVRHLLSHTSGLPGTGAENTPLRRRLAPLEAFTTSFTREPVSFPPGTAFQYSNVGILLAAELAGRVASGTARRRVDQPATGAFLEVLKSEILAPLRMQRSGMPAPSEWDAYTAWVADTGQEQTPYEVYNSRYFRGLGLPWAGLYTTPRDLVRFLCQFVAPEGARTPSILTAQARRLMALAQEEVAHQGHDAAATGGDAAALPRGAAAAQQVAPWPLPWPRVCWGLGWEVKGEKRPHQAGKLTSPGTFGHVGTSGALCWADPTTDLICILLTNRALTARWATEPFRFAQFSDAVVAGLGAARG